MLLSQLRRCRLDSISEPRAFRRRICLFFIYAFRCSLQVQIRSRIIWLFITFLHHRTELTDSDIARTQYESIRVNTMNMLELFGSAPPGSIACTSFRNIRLDSSLTFSFKGRITLIAPWPSTPTADGSVRLQPNIVSYENPEL